MYAYQVGPNLFSHSSDVAQDRSNYFNHACDPNTWYADSHELRINFFLEGVLKDWLESDAGGKTSQRVTVTPRPPSAASPPRPQHPCLVAPSP